MLGTYINNFMKNENIETISVTRKEYNILELNRDMLEKLLTNYSIDANTVIINCAGIIPQTDKNKIILDRDYYIINSLFPVILSDICNKFNAQMIHISSDSVYSGTKGNYIESDEHNPINKYGISKSLGELCNCAIIRATFIGEEEEKKISLLEWVKLNDGKEVNGYTNYIYNGITCLELSKIIYIIITKNMYWKGVRHIFGPSKYSKYDLIKIIKEKYNLNIKINEHNLENIIDRSLDTIYDTNSTFNSLDISEQINDLVSHHKKI